MKNIIKVFSVGLLLLTIFAKGNFVLAQEVSTVASSQPKYITLASVGIYDVKLGKLSRNIYKVSFRILNEGGVQSDIRYGLQLINTKDLSVVDSQLVNKSLTLDKNEGKNITLTYEIPGFLPNGDYKLFVVAQNKNDVPLAFVGVNGSEINVSISDRKSTPFLENCFLSLSEDSTKKYTLNEAVNVEGGTLSITCDIINNSQNTYKNILVQHITHQNNIFGDIVRNNKIKAEIIDLKPNSSGKVTFNLSENLTSGIYMEDLFLINENGKKISPSVFAYYLIPGSHSLNISNTILNKSSYLAGETAEVKVFWSYLSKSSEENVKYIFDINIKDMNNNTCGTLRKTEIGKDAGRINQSIFEILLENDCQNAVLSIQILDAEENILETIEINSNASTQNINIDAGVSKIKLGGLSTLYVVLFVVILVFIAFGILYIIRKNNNNKV